MHKLDLIFLVSAAEFQQKRQVINLHIHNHVRFITMYVLYNFVIKEAIDGLSSETIV